MAKLHITRIDEIFRDDDPARGVAGYVVTYMMPGGAKRSVRVEKADATENDIIDAVRNDYKRIGHLVQREIDV